MSLLLNNILALSIGLFSGFLYAVLFLFQKRTTMIASVLFTSIRLISLSALWWYLLQHTQIPLILMILFFLPTFWVTVSWYRGIAYGRS